MIKVEFFTYTDEQWNAIREQVLDDLGVDVDTITHQVTPTLGKYSITGTLSVRDRIELAVSKYHSFNSVQSPSRAELDALRKDAEKLRARIIDALAVQVVSTSKYDDVATPLPRPGVHADMVTETDQYFWTLLRILNRQIEQAGRRGDNSRKPARDQCWNELRARWCELGGKPRGIATAKFVSLASLPVMKSAVPDLASVKQWLERHPAQ